VAQKRGLPGYRRQDSLICIWNTATGTGEPVKKLKGPSGLREIIFCNDDTLFSVHDDGSIYLWDLSNNSGELLYQSASEKALCIAWDNSRKNLLAGSQSGTILFFNLSQKGITGRYISHTAGIDKLIFNKDFSMVASAGWDKVIRIYNYKEFFESHDFVRGVISIENPDARARSLFFTNDNQLVAGMSDKNIRIWETSPVKLVQLVCQLVKRDFTIKEWEDYIGSEIDYEKTCGNNQ